MGLELIKTRLGKTKCSLPTGIRLDSGNARSSGLVSSSPVYKGDCGSLSFLTRHRRRCQFQKKKEKRDAVSTSSPAVSLCVCVEICGEGRKGEEESVRVFDASAKVSCMMPDMKVVHDLGVSRHGSLVA